MDRPGTVLLSALNGDLFETWDRICRLHGWPQSFVGRIRLLGVEYAFQGPRTRSGRAEQVLVQERLPEDLFGEGESIVECLIPHDRISHLRNGCAVSEPLPESIEVLQL